MPTYNLGTEEAEGKERKKMPRPDTLMQRIKNKFGPLYSYLIGNTDKARKVSRGLTGQVVIQMEKAVLQYRQPCSREDISHSPLRCVE